MSDRPLILLANDDGVSAHGLRALHQALEPIAQVYVVAPEREHSGRSHAITLRHPLRVRKVSECVFATDGTPVDCVYVALHSKDLLPRRPDLVVSGINHGANLGTDIFYSGTVAAAREGALRGIPSLAFSSLNLAYLEEASRTARDIVAQTLQQAKPGGHAVLINVNFPATRAKGLRLSRLGERLYKDEVTVRKDPRGTKYYWVGGPGALHQPSEGTDTDAVDAGFASLTPLSLEATQDKHFDFASSLVQNTFAKETS
ncbi:MAG: 5'/3'-nucleotidase SurE [Myxococcales bacterium]|nr:MAG: 5'/3'-nucleotidase SurE [Myxococcales bacterium]